MSNIPIEIQWKYEELANACNFLRRKTVKCLSGKASIKFVRVLTLSIAFLFAPISHALSAPTSPVGKYLHRLLRSRGERHFKLVAKTRIAGESIGN